MLAESIFDLSPFFTSEGLLALLTLSALEIVLGIDNIVFIAILTGKLPPDQQGDARRYGLGAAMIMRILLLLSISWIMSLTKPLFTLFEHSMSWKDIILIVGGLFLLAKATYEIHHRLEDVPDDPAGARKVASFATAIVQIMAVDLVFSLDSVITAVGMAKHIQIMIAAVVLSVIVMMLFAGPVSDFVHRHPTVKMLALSFLLLIGLMLVVDGFGHHIPKGYIYFAMGFSLFVELLNIRAGHGKKRAPAGHP